MTAATLRRDLELQASTDHLTGLLNRRALSHAADRAIAASLRTRSPLSAILLDLDRFKLINDTFGHRCGDAALLAVSAALQSALPPAALLGRIGGDEFVILLPGPLPAATALAALLHSTLHQLSIDCTGTPIFIETSCGLAQFDPAFPSWDHLLLLCDQALYADKNARRSLITYP